MSENTNPHRRKIERLFRQIGLTVPGAAGDDRGFVRLIAQELTPDLSGLSGPVETPEPINSNERWGRAAEQLAATMSEEHRAFVLRETARLIESRTFNLSSPAMPNLLRQFWYMVSLMACDQEIAEHKYGLPPEVAQIYLDTWEATALDQCRECRYLSPVLLAMGRQMDRMPLHPAFNAYSFFLLCPLCGGATGGYAEPHYFNREVHRISAYVRAGRKTHAGGS